MPQTWLLSGIPRSGTSLSCRLAGDLLDTVSLSEPLNGRPFRERARDPRDACACIGEFVEHARARILKKSIAPSMLVNGRLDDNMVGPEPAADGLRRPQANWGEIAIDKPLSSNFTLVVKHNALFAALLPNLVSSFPCLALVRNPLSVLVSWQTVSLPVHRGRIPEGEAHDGRLYRTLELESDALQRQIIVLDWFFGRFRTCLSSRNIARYEDLIETGGMALFRTIGHAQARPTALKNRNDNALCGSAMVETLLKALLETGGYWTSFYRPSDCEQVADRIRRGR